MGDIQERYEVGAATISVVVEQQTDRVPPAMLFPDATPERVREHAWLAPAFAAADGTLSMRVQAFVVEIGADTVLVDPCVGNEKCRVLPMWNGQNVPFLERLSDAGFEVEDIDLVAHTHLHADHVGWGTQRVDGQWTPTFTKARYIYTAAELEHCRTHQLPGEDVFADSVAPILAAGLADVVSEDAKIVDGLRFEPTPGHTPGHASLWVDSEGECAVITGDFIHHPVQLAEPAWAQIADADPEVAQATRRRMLTKLADGGHLVLGTHFPTRPAGYVRDDGAGCWTLEGRRR